MIISASRRTDIPAFYADWFLNRIRSGYCTVPNPFNSNQVSRVSLKPDDVDIIVFWSRNPQPLIPSLTELKARGYRYYFQYTVMGNPTFLDPHGPQMDVSIRHFKTLSDHIGPEKVIWRYDPIFFSEMTDQNFHKRTFEQIARALKSSTHRVVVSIADIYRKNKRRIEAFSRHSIVVTEPNQNAVADLFPFMSGIAEANGMEILSCAEDIDLTSYGTWSFPDPDRGISPGARRPTCG